MRCIASIVLLSFLAQLVHAQAPPAAKKPGVSPAKPGATPAKPGSTPAKPAQSPEAAIRAASSAYAAALNAGDLKTAGTFWAAEGEFVDAAGDATPAKTVLSERLPARYGGATRPQLKLTIRAVHLITADTATEDGSVEFKSSDASAAQRTNYNSVWVNKQGRWQIHSLRELPPAPSAGGSGDLTKLEWLIGNWTAKSGRQNVSVDCSWSDDRAWLLRDITVEQEGETPQHIQQRIGRRLTSPQLKSWAFDSEGGTAESTWEPRADTWVVVSQGVASDGEPVTATSVYSDIGPSGFTLSCQDARAGSFKFAPVTLRFGRAGAATSPATGAGETSKPATASGAKPSPVNSQAAAAKDKAEKDKLLASPQWREVERAYHQYLSLQKVYTDEEVKRAKAELAAKIDKMTAAQLRELLDDARDKLAVLLSKQADEARNWLGQRMAVEVKLTPEKIKQERPDIARMNSAQLAQWLQQWDQQRGQTKQSQQAFDAGRAAQIKSIEAAKQKSAAEREAAKDRAYYQSTYAPYGSYYGVGPVNNPGRAAPYGGWRY